ncbi:hypothetical protein [Clostridium sp. D33t1_170424_F3]|uniref:hypothetical protein n=1 Tax=Clostridium sp. D33t1_170424_F3 TaxID=2787099 RepID=UPI0018AC8CA0|nr:hypothetical protein [Clostridium sp. D33t1_170424_F3]
MKIQLLIATQDTDYSDHLSAVLLDKYAKSFEVSTCSSAARLSEMLSAHRYDAALLDPELAAEKPLKEVALPLLLWDEITGAGAQTESFGAVRKYQRVSAIVEDVLGKYAGISGKKEFPESGSAHVAAVWSPAGGTGKTTVALAYAAQCVANGKQTVYLDLEYFSSVPVYFSNDGKSISEAFGKQGGNLVLLLQSIRRQDDGSGIFYFCRPNNYDDMNVLSVRDVQELVAAAASGADEVVLDLSAACDERCRSLLKLADTVLAVVDGSQKCRVKWEQFCSQHDLFEQIRPKCILVGNMGAQAGAAVERSVTLPYVPSDNPVSIYKSLSAVNFGV